ncbi:hypothetical protein TGRH88_053660 [Toxoplasma gondii]|uniref:Uncharacterized protein n=1 Tax=Toxoplasma gondii TaxID=5811 RepID=A0A7J6JXX3_TOXGO|nr:hypothetical protein TGRH88_053660 [Toxoplasma gondii]
MAKGLQTRIHVRCKDLLLYSFPKRCDAATVRVVNARYARFFVQEERRIIWQMSLVGSLCYRGTAMQLRIVLFIAFNMSANMSGGYRLRLSPACENRKLWSLIRKWVCLCTSSRLLFSIHAVLMREAVIHQPSPRRSGRTVL